MSRQELRQLEQCMGHLAYVFEQLGITEARFSGGTATFRHNGSPLNRELMNNLCQHISDLCKDELATGEEDLPEYYFD